MPGKKDLIITRQAKRNNLKRYGFNTEKINAAIENTISSLQVKTSPKSNVEINESTENQNVEKPDKDSEVLSIVNEKANDGKNCNVSPGIANNIDINKDLNIEDNERYAEAATIIQKWWRGETTRYHVAAKIITINLYSGNFPNKLINKIPLYHKVKLSHAAPSEKWRFPFDTKFELLSLRNRAITSPSAAASKYVLPLTPVKQFQPWPKPLLESLNEFLSSLEAKPVQTSKKGLLIDNVYKSTHKTNSVPFAFSVEKRALKQLKLSRESRSKMLQNRKITDSFL